MKKYNTQNLTPFNSNWKSKGKTKVIRIPIELEEAVLNFAHQLDNGKDLEADSRKLKEILKQILEKIHNKEKGFKTNSASQLINNIKSISHLLQ